MTEPNEIEQIVQALKKVPEKHLMIVELARELVKEDGELDFDTLAERQREVNLAVAEAKAYSKATSRAVDSLRRLKARQAEVY